VAEDAMIAAIASTNGLRVATRKVRNFQFFSVPSINPFKFQLP
jgi:predicted nucleic acid-binding protein